MTWSSRSECENCKSSDFTNIEDEEGDVLNETMTLQRRPLEQGEELPYYRTSLTLPTNTKRPRFVLKCCYYKSFHLFIYIQ